MPWDRASSLEPCKIGMDYSSLRTELIEFQGQSNKLIVKLTIEDLCAEKGILQCCSCRRFSSLIIEDPLLQLSESFVFFTRFLLKMARGLLLWAINIQYP